MKHILIVDDELEVLELLAELLHSTYRVSTAPHGQAAFDLLMVDTSIDCVVLDLMMPQMSGEELASELLRSGKSVPLVIASARPDVAWVAKSIGARDFLTKPYKTAELIQKIDRACGSTPSGESSASGGDGSPPPLTGSQRGGSRALGKAIPACMFAG